MLLFSVSFFFWRGILFLHRWKHPWRNNQFSLLGDRRLCSACSWCETSLRYCPWLTPSQHSPTPVAITQPFHIGSQLLLCDQFLFSKLPPSHHTTARDERSERKNLRWWTSKLWAINDNRHRCRGEKCSFVFLLHSSVKLLWCQL